MNVQTLPIAPGQFIYDLFDEIPSDVVLNKTLPALRATTHELQTKRNSILLECNVPVIKDKCTKYKHLNLIGIYKHSPDDVVEYLKRDIPYKKIMVTPESFPIVMKAMKEAGIDVYNGYFLLWDECDRAIQDVRFRRRIVLPVKDFFKFKSKALISATALPPTDPRFLQEGFRYLKLVPDFDYKQTIKLVHTNNVASYLKEYLKSNPSKQYFIFLNSTKAIAAIQKALNIKKQSYTFCSMQSMLQLKLSKFFNCSTDLGPFKKYNFFTGRFFSAVDIDFNGDPHIIIVTDLVYAKHSLIDPYSETVQIIGRFRKSIGTVKNICHITNTQQDINFMRPDDIADYLGQSEFFYDGLTGLLQGATNLGSVKALREAQEGLPWKKYLHDDDTVNHFMKDNLYFEEQVKSYYRSGLHLKDAYNAGGYFNVDYNEQLYQFTDVERKAAEKSPLKNVTRLVITHLHKLQTGDFSLYDQHREKQLLTEYFPEIVALYDNMGYQICEELRFNISAIKASQQAEVKRKEGSNFEFIQFLNERFIVGGKYSSEDIKLVLMQAISRFKLFLLKANVQLLKQYFHLSERKTIRYKEDGSDIKGYLITGAKYPYL